MPEQSAIQPFPAGFTWGAATSAYQIEGAWDQAGKGLSIWDTFSRQPGKTFRGATGEIAAGHYQRWPEDVRLMAELGLNAYRFSVAWARIFPAGAGPVNPAGLDFYDRLVDALLAQGIQPYLTLYHYDLPQALQDLGGWAAPETGHYFANYAHTLAKRLGDRVKAWITLNEPEVIALNGHFLGDHAPGLQDPLVALQVANNLLLSHGLAVQALRAALPGAAQVGIALNLTPVEPASPSQEDLAAARRIDAVINRLFIEPLYLGHVPQEAQELFGPFLPALSPQDLQRIAVPLDFLGINYYTRAVICHDPDIPLIQASQVQPSGSDYSQMWEIYPPGLYALLERVWNDYRPARILITENGIPVPDGLDFDGRVRDDRRTHYLAAHLVQVQRAIAAGIPVQGYFVWSLLDNFEWALGYQMRFGLIYVDFETQKRTIKDSGRWYAGVIRKNGL